MELNFNLSVMPQDSRALPLDPDVIYDVLIIGGGPASMTAAVYCMRKGVTTGLVTTGIGGQVAETSVVENYLGYTYIEGIELVDKFREHVKQFEIGFGEGIIVEQIVNERIKKAVLDNGLTLHARTLIISTGKSPRRLNVPGERELAGKGVAYCSICDAPLFKGKKVAVVGGGNSGIESAIDLARVAEHVTIIQFLDKLTADKILIDSLNGFSNLNIIYEHEVSEIHGNNKVESITVNSRKNGTTAGIELDGIFIEIGLIPNSGLVKGIVDLNEFGEIQIDCSCKTSVPGIFAAGDVTSVPYKQIIIAGGEGAKAALSACDYLLREV